MKVTASEIEGSQVVLEMEIEPDRVEKAMDRAYRRLASRMNVPGFRRGKAPRVLVERMIGREALWNDALEILVPEAYQEAVQQAGIDPVDTPKLDIVSAEPLSVKATVPVRPTVELGDYRSIRQSTDVPEISEEQVATALENLRQSRAAWTPVEREARAGDMVTMDLSGHANDTSIIDRQGIRAVLDPDSHIIAPGVVEQIIGMGPGDHKAFDVNLPDDFVEKTLAGKQAAIDVTVNEVNEKEVPDLDDELARSLGDYPTVDDLRAAVRKELEAQVQAQARLNLEESVLAAVVDQAKAEPPSPWVGEQAEMLRKSTEERVTREGLTFEQYLRLSNRTEESFRDEAVSTARRQLKRSLVLDAVAEAEGIAVSEEEIDAALEQALAASGGRVESAAERDRLRNSLRSALRERKTVGRLIEIAEGAEQPAEATEEASDAVSAAEQRQTEEE